MTVLYISYDGLLEPLGQSQVLAYLEKLATKERVYLLTFEKSEDWADNKKRIALERRVSDAGISWHPRRYHKRPSSLATAWDIFVGSLSALWLVLRYRLKVIHARSDVPALMAWAVTWVTSVRFLYDMRGFWVDERVDGGLWPANGLLYRLGKWFERRFLLNADHVVVLTNAAVAEISKYPFLAGRTLAVTVIPTCADLERFKPLSINRNSGFVLGYVGTAGTWYRFDEFVACFNVVRELVVDAHLLIINRNEHQLIREQLRAGGVPDDIVELRSVEPHEVPGQMARMHATAFFIKQSFSKKASAPTKLAEFLGCGVPCLANTGVGDMAEMIEAERVGIAIPGFQPEVMRVGVERLLSLVQEPGLSRRCRSAATKHFSLEEGVTRYAEIYEKLGTGL